MGSSVFHPEASRVARMAAGGRYGLAQSLFQVGGNLGGASGPLLAALHRRAARTDQPALLLRAALIADDRPVPGRQLVSRARRAKPVARKAASAGRRAGR
jgi:FSR family fosmidomycin resistance protein-like MFS transporter